MMFEYWRVVNFIYLVTTSSNYYSGFEEWDYAVHGQRHQIFIVFNSHHAA